MARILVLGDCHFGARNDSIAFLEYFFKFYDNIFFPYLEANPDIKTVIQVGDIVDRRKFINYIVLNRLKNDFIFRLKKMGIDLHVLIGNHDVPYKNTNEVNSMQELFGVEQGQSFPKFYAEPVTINLEGCDMCMMPWINNSNYNHCMTHIKNTKAQVLFGHLDIEGFYMNKDMKSEGGLQPKVFEGFDVVGSGHFHTKSRQGNIHYFGTPYEMTWSDYNDQKGFHIFDTDTRTFEFIHNPYRMFHKIFYDDKKKNLEELTSYDFDSLNGAYVKVVTINKTNPYWFDMFIEKIYKSNPENISIVDDHKHLDQTNEDELINEAEDTMTIMRKYIEGLDTSVDKKKLTSLIGSLYNEALHYDG